MKKISPLLALLLLLSACAVSTNEAVLGTTESQVEIRNYQSRRFDTVDKDLVMRALISTMQDLGFIIERADTTLGIVSGTSYTHSSVVTASVIAPNEKQVVVRLNSQAHKKTITDPIAYQNFFNALEQSLFLEAHAVE